MRCLIIVLLVSLPPGAVADDWSAEGGYFAVIVADLDASIDWYQGMFGLEERSRAAREGRFRIANLARDGLFVELIELDSAAAGVDRSRGFFKAGWLVDDLDAFAATLDLDEPPRILVDERNGVRLLQLRDPDGNRVQLMELLRGESD